MAMDLAAKFAALFTHPTFWATALAWLTADLFKVVLLFLNDGVVNWRRFFGTGGMPSSHTAFISGFTACVGLSEGFTSAIFGMALGVAILTSVDACGLRRSAGMQAEVLNKIVAELYRGKKSKPPRLRETLGHTVAEVVVGAVLGVAVVLLVYPKHP